MILLVSMAFAGPVEEDVARARALVLEGDFAGAKEALDRAEAEAAKTETVVLASTLAGIWFYRGAVEYHSGDRSEAMLQDLRRALVIDLEYSFDREAIPDPQTDDLFYALRSEVGQRPKYESGAREDAVDAKIFVDGQLMTEYDYIRLGNHLVQVMCPNGKLETEWMEIEENVDLYKQCRGKVTFGGEGEVDPYAMVIEDPPEEEPRKEREPREKKEKEPREKKEKEPREKKEKEPREPLDIDVASVGLVGGGAALLAGGAALNFVVVEPTYTAIEAARLDPASVSRAKADLMTQQFNRSRYATMGLLVAGAGCATAGILMNDRIGVIAAPAAGGGGGVVITGTF